MPKRSWKDLFGLGRKSPTRRYEWSEDLRFLLNDLAHSERRSMEDLQAELLSSALADRRTSAGLWQHWNLLTPREQQVLALVCLGYTNRQIAARLGLSAETVKTHVKYVLRKLAIHSKTDLRLLFSSWDFSEWEK